MALLDVILVVLFCVGIAVIPLAVVDIFRAIFYGVRLRKHKIINEYIIEIRLPTGEVYTNHD